jgi:hypothetical protein
MIISLLVDVTAALLVLAQIILDYTWTDGRTKKRKVLRRVLPWGLLLLLLFSGWKTIKQERDNSLLQVQLGGLNSQLTDVRQLLSPFVSMASEKYPGEDVKTALTNLASDVDRLKRASAPRHVTLGQRTRIVDILRPLAPMTIKVQRRGELEAYNYANELIEVFRQAGITVEVDGGLGGLSPPEYGVIWWARDKMSPAAAALGAVMQTLEVPSRAHFVPSIDTEGAIRVGLKAPKE